MFNKKALYEQTPLPTATNVVMSLYSITDVHRLEVSEQTLGGIPLGFGIVVEDKPSELSYYNIPF